MGYVDASADLDATFAALADPTRRAILARLATGEASVGELAEPFAMSQPAISKHLKVLERAGLIRRGRDAQRRPCRLEAKPLQEANAWIERYREICEGNYARLDALLVEHDQRLPAEGRERMIIEAQCHFFSPRSPGIRRSLAPRMQKEKARTAVRACCRRGVAQFIGSCAYLPSCQRNQA